MRNKYFLYILVDVYVTRFHLISSIIFNGFS